MPNPSSDVLERVAAAIAREHTHLDKARAAIAAMPTIERLSAELERYRKELSGIRWRSADKDNMEFAATITYSQMDRIMALTASPQAAPEHTRTE